MARSENRARELADKVRHVPGLRRIPAVRLLAASEVVLLARDHLHNLTPEERRRLATLVRRGRGRRGKLSERERDELTRLIAKTEPRRLLGETVDVLSPVPVPRRLLYGRQHKG